MELLHFPESRVLSPSSGEKSAAPKNKKQQKRKQFLKRAGRARGRMDSRKWICYTKNPGNGNFRFLHLSMPEQLPLFQRKTFPAILSQGMPIVSPTPQASILSTLPAYYTYLQSQGYSKYTPADFCGDVKKCGAVSYTHLTLPTILRV